MRIAFAVFLALVVPLAAGASTITYLADGRSLGTQYSSCIGSLCYPAAESTLQPESPFQEHWSAEKVVYTALEGTAGRHESGTIYTAISTTSMDYVGVSIRFYDNLAPGTGYSSRTEVDPIFDITFSVDESAAFLLGGVGPVDLSTSDDLQHLFQSNGPDHLSSGFLVAGTAYRLRGPATGSMHFELVPAPEASTALLILGGMAALAHGRRRHA